MHRPRPLLHHTIHRADPEAGPDAEWVVLVHGAGVTSEIWDHQIEAYRRSYNLLLPVLRGHGGTRASDHEDRPPYTWEGVSLDVLDVMDFHGIESAHMVGVSLGSIVVRTVAELAPERVRSMVMAGGVVRLEPLARLLVALARVLHRALPYLWLYAINAWIILPRRSHRESRRLVVRSARRLGGDEFRRWMRLTRPVPALLRRHTARDPGIPTLYVSGDQDHLFLPGVRHTAAAHENAELHVIESCGHVCTVQCPEAFNDASLAFLRQQSPPGTA